MHFWIDKRSQGCGRYRVPLSFTGPTRNQRLLCVGVHPKLMVTPVHRFQSIESVVTNTTRHPRCSSYHTRLPINCGPSISHSASTSRNAILTNSIELLDNEHRENNQEHRVNNHEHVENNNEHRANNHTTNPRNSSTSKLKCFVWSFFALITLFIAGAKYYFRPGIMGVEAFVLCTILGIILLIGGVISLYDAIINPDTNNYTSQQQQPLPVQISNETHETSEVQMVNERTRCVQIANEIPPPPYHIAIMLPKQRNNIEPIATIVADSPPPAYEKLQFHPMN